MINTIESGIDIEVLGGIDIGIEIDKSISGILILVLILLRRASNIEYHGMLTNHICREYFSNFCLVLGTLDTVLKILLSNLVHLTFQAIVSSAFFRMISIDIDMDIEIDLFGSIDIGIDIDNRPMKLLILILVLIRYLLIILKLILNRFSGIDHVC